MMTKMAHGNPSSQDGPAGKDTGKITGENTGGPSLEQNSLALMRSKAWHFWGNPLYVSLNQSRLCENERRSKYRLLTDFEVLLNLCGLIGVILASMTMFSSLGDLLFSPNDVVTSGFRTVLTAELTLCLLTFTCHLRSVMEAEYIGLTSRDGILLLMDFVGGWPGSTIALALGPKLTDTYLSRRRIAMGLNVLILVVLLRSSGIRGLRINVSMVRH